MSNLQLHQLRAAAVAKIIAENFNKPLDIQSIILACLFHDMGNIIKFDFSRFLEFLKPEGLDHWQLVKDEYINKYGNEEHKATKIIAKEINLSPQAMFCLEHIGFFYAIENEIGDSFERKICNYADMRIDPYGVVSMEERINEARKRYKGRKHNIVSDTFELSVQALKNIEKQIFNKANIKPEEITNERIQSVIEELRNFVIPSLISPFEP